MRIHPLLHIRMLASPTTNQRTNEAVKNCHLVTLSHSHLVIAKWKHMSIFATTLGTRPIAAQGTEHTDRPGRHNAVVQPLIASVLGVRPQGECPGLIDWGGVVLHEANEPAIQVPPASNQQVLGTEEMLAAIDEALRQNIAQVAVNGLLITE
jgi:hypothetical protein